MMRRENHNKEEEGTLFVEVYGDNLCGDCVYDDFGDGNCMRSQ